jgi:hypothetical protein
MNKVKLHFLFFVVFTIVLSSCKDDDDSKNTPDNKFTFGTTEVKIEKGAFIYDVSPGQDTDGNDYYRNELFFAPSGVTITAAGEDDFDVTGEGTILTLLINNSGQELQVGTYTWQGEENEKPFDFWDGTVYVNWNTNSEGRYRMTEGTVVVTKSGSTYTITAEGEAYPMTYNGDWWETDLEASPVTVTLQFEGELSTFAQDF